MDKQQLDSRFFVARFSGQPEERFGFQLAVPRSSRHDSVQNYEVPNDPCAPVTRFTSEADDMHLTISVALLSREVTAGDFAIIDAFRRGRIVARRRDEEDSNGTRAQIVSICGENHRRRLVRSRVIKDGNRLFRIEVDAPFDRSGDTDADWDISLSSFTLLAPESSPAAEPLCLYEANDGTSFSFRYPGSWRKVQPIPSGLVNRVELVNELHARTAGCIILEATPSGASTSATVRIREFAEYLKHSGVKLGGSPVVPVDGLPDFPVVYAYAPAAMKDGHDFAVWALWIRKAGSIVFLSFTGDGRKYSFENWAINKRAFEIVRDSLQIGAAAGTDQAMGGV
jgi:hypothetical protein